MSNFREFRSKNKLKSTNKDTSFVDFGAEDIGKNSLSVLLKQARKNGSLNLANRKLDAVPREVYLVNCAESKVNNPISFEGDIEGWWESVFLNKLIISANAITKIDNDINLLDKLTYLDLSDNKIEVLPTSICDLLLLNHLNLSKNSIVSLPSDIHKLDQLQQLLASHNKLKNVPELSSMNGLETLDLSNNNLTDLPSSIRNLKSLRHLNLSHNQIITMPDNLDTPQGLRFIDLSHNKLVNFPDKFGIQTEQLYLHVNRLVSFPIVCLRKELKELSVTHNQIKTLTPEHISFIPSLTTLAIANNVLAEIPEAISNLTMLANLDLSNNELKSLPLSMGNMQRLKNLSIDGNPFRAMKRTVINAGADAIKEYLRLRNTAEVEIPNPGSISTGLGQIGAAQPLDQSDLRATGVVRLAEQGLTDLSEEICTSLKSVVVKEFLLNKNKLAIFPPRILSFASTLLDLDLSSNLLTELPASIDSLVHLRRLNISNNKVHSLPASLANIHSLIHLSVSYNVLGAHIPDVVYRCSGLETLAMSHCGIESLDAAKIRTLSSLTALDLSNNDIGSLPPELGLCDNIKSLNIEGNCFKVPRVAVIARGTAAVMEYLRSRIAD